MSWVIWITGPPASGTSAIARGVAAEFQTRGQQVTWLELDALRASLAPAVGSESVLYGALAYLAAVLGEAGQPVLIDAPGGRRVWPDLVREAVPRFAEVQLVGPIERPGTTGPGVDEPYEAALAPELLIDPAAESLATSVERVVSVADRLSAEADAASARPDAGGDPAWAIWITGRPGSGKSTLARRAFEALGGAGTRVRLLELAPVQRFLLEGPATGEPQQDLVHRVLAYAAKLLTEADVSVIVDATAVRRAWRQAARELIPRFAEIQLLCPTEICLDRERAIRWGLTFETTRSVAATRGPDIELAYEESIHPDLAVWTDVCDVQSATDRILATIERLAGHSPSPTRARPGL
jgi:adenylylsulfate kinase